MQGRRIRRTAKPKEPEKGPSTAARAQFLAVCSGVFLCYAAAGQVRAHLFPMPEARQRAAQIDAEAPSEGAGRGMFVTGDQKIAARTQDSWLVQMHYNELTPHPDFFVEMSHATGINPAEMRLGYESYLSASVAQQKAKGAGFAEYDVLLSRDQKKQAEKVYRKWSNNGMSFISNKARIYPMGDSFVDLIGVASQEEGEDKRRREAKGRVGMENALNRFLSGEGGLPLDEDKGRVKINGLTPKLKAQIEAKTKKNPSDRVIELTVDSDLQRSAFESLRKAVIRSSAEAGCALVLDPQTGDLLAAADYPIGSHGLHKTSQQIPRFAPTDAAWESGSMMKLITLAKGYTDRKIAPGETFVSTAALMMRDGRAIRNHDGKAFGSVDARMAIAHSCNVTAARWALRIGRQSFYQFLRDTKVLRPVGLASEGETPGLFHFGESDRDLASLGFGQGINLTPASTIGLFGMLANEGEFVAPRVIRSIAGVNIPAERRGFYLSPEACRMTLDAAEAVVESPQGTGYKLRVPGIRLGGKTGTAQIIKGGKVAGYRANFVGFVPSHQPQYVVLVMVDRPKGADFYGGSIAGPVFVDLTKKLMEKGLVKSPIYAKKRSEPAPLTRPLPEGPVHIRVNTEAKEKREARQREESAQAQPAASSPGRSRQSQETMTRRSSSSTRRTAEREEPTTRRSSSSSARRTRDPEATTTRRSSSSARRTAERKEPTTRRTSSSSTRRTREPEATTTRRSSSSTRRTAEREEPTTRRSATSSSRRTSERDEQTTRRSSTSSTRRTRQADEPATKRSSASERRSSASTRARSSEEQATKRPTSSQRRTSSSRKTRASEEPSTRRAREADAAPARRTRSSSRTEESPKPRPTARRTSSTRTTSAKTSNSRRIEPAAKKSTRTRSSDRDTPRTRSSDRG